jgi:NIMA (never in mitosis gene a)-related kinase
VKLGDLGMCKVMNQKDELISTRVGTPVYFAPEIIQHQLYSYPVDIWALGCSFFYLATLEHPFKEATIETLSYYVIEKDPKPIKGHYGGYLINFIASLLTKNAKQRPDIYQVIQTIKNKDNPNPPNKVMVFDFKKLIMMKPDLEKLD